MILQLFALLKLAFIAFIGYNSFKTTPYEVDTVHDIDVQGTKICFEGDYELQHFFEERVVEMEASHENFLITNTDIQKPFFNNLLNRSISDSLPNTKEFNHLIDTKIENNIVTVVIPSYQKTCFEFLVEADTEPLTIKIHSTTQLCYSTLIFFTLQIILFLFYPTGFVYEILALLIIFLYMIMMPYVHPLLMKYPIYQDTIAPKYALPLLCNCDTICLIVYHSMKFYYNFASYFLKDVFAILEKYFAIADTYILIFTQWLEKWIMIIDEKIPSKEFIYEWLKLYWKECIVSVILFIITIYIFYPSHHDYSVQIRLICVFAISLSLAYISTSLAMKVVCFSILFCILIIKVKAVLQLAWKMIKRLFNHA